MGHPMYILSMPAALPVVLLLFTVGQSTPVNPQKNFELISKQAETAQIEDRFRDAIGLYSEGVRLRPTWSDGWWALGSLLYEQDRFPEAQLAFEHFVKSAPESKNGPGYAFLALCEYETKNYDASLKHFQDWARNGSPGTDALLDVAGFHWALLLTREERFAQALYLLATKATKLGSTPAVAEAMGLASLRIASLPEDYPSLKREQVWLAGEAAVFASRRDFARTNEFARRLADRYGQEVNVNYFLGTLSGYERNFREAADNYHKELQISPKHVPAMVELALVQLENFEPEEALAVAERAVRLKPEYARAHLAYGKALSAAQQLPKAAHELEIAKELASESPEIRSALANTYMKLGRLADAKRESEAFLALKDKEEVLVPPQKKIEPVKKKAQPKS